MAQVFRGTDTVLGRPVAIKVLAPQYSQDDGFVARFRREAQAAARLNHPNLVGVYDTGSDDGTHYIVMEFVEGRTLADFLSNGGRLMPDRAIELAESVCQALAFAHARGVIHRDIKPGNVMVTRQGEVKVMDFGIARTTSGAETLAQTAAVLGTAAYLSPEQAQGQQVDARSDLYSLGVVLYEMVTGRVPFTGDTPVAVAYKHVQETPEGPSKLNPDISPELERVIMRALAKNPVNRYQSAEEFRADLGRARRGEAVEATPLLSDAETQVISRADRTQTLPPIKPPRRGLRWAVGGTIVLLVLSALGAGLFVLATTLLKTNPATSVQVPRVIGFPKQQAISTLTNAGLKVGKIGTKTTTKQPSDTVLGQSPPPGKKVDGGSTVDLVVARPPQQVVVPDLTGKTQAEANAALVAKKLVLGSVVPRPSDTVPKGQVISQSPSPGVQVYLHTPVDIIVSSGPQLITVPDVTCLPFGAAKNRLEGLGLNVLIGGTAPPNPLCPQPNKVAAQIPAPGSAAHAGDTVTLYYASPVSPSPPPSPPPSPSPSPT